MILTPSLFFSLPTDTMLQRRVHANPIFTAANAGIIVAIAIVLLGFASSGRWPINNIIDLGAANASTPSHYKAGVSGQRFHMRAWREAPSLSSVMSSINKERSSFPSAPLNDPDGHPFPICDVWAVITTINPPSKVVHQLASMKGLCVCIVADEKSAPVYDVSGNVVYLTPAMQV